jgi:hypothetical protein
MRFRDGRYNLMFEEWVVEGHFIISPRVTFEVPVRILGGLMALGYEIGSIMRRTSEVYSDDRWAGQRGGAAAVKDVSAATRATPALRPSTPLFLPTTHPWAHPAALPAA